MGRKNGRVAKSERNTGGGVRATEHEQPRNRDVFLTAANTKLPAGDRGERLRIAEHPTADPCDRAHGLIGFDGKLLSGQSVGGRAQDRCYPECQMVGVEHVRDYRLVDGQRVPTGPVRLVGGVNIDSAADRLHEMQRELADIPGLGPGASLSASIADRMARWGADRLMAHEAAVDIGPPPPE